MNWYSSSIQLQILHSLAIYKYLCLSQFEMLNFNLSKKTLSNNLKSLNERGLCWKTTYRFSPKDWKKEDVWHLLPRWKELLLKFTSIHIEDVKIPKGRVGAIEEYDHRKMTISIHISMRTAIKRSWGALDFFLYDFEKSKTEESKRYQCATKVKSSLGSLKSDALFKVKNDQRAFLFCLEVHNQYRVWRLIRQTKPYAYSLAEWSRNTKYWFNQSPRVLVVYEMESTLYNALEVLSADTFYLYMRDYFLFKTYESTLNDPLNNRMNLRKEKVNISIEE